MRPAYNLITEHRKRLSKADSEHSKTVQHIMTTRHEVSGSLVGIVISEDKWKKKIAIEAACIEMHFPAYCIITPKVCVTDRKGDTIKNNCIIDVSSHCSRVITTISLFGELCHCAPSGSAVGCVTVLRVTPRSVVSLC